MIDYLINYIKLLQLYIFICNFIYYYYILLYTIIIYYAYYKQIVWIFINYILLLISFINNKKLFKYILIKLILFQIYNLLFINFIDFILVFNSIILYIYEILNINIFDIFILNNINFIFTLLYLYKYI